MARGGGGGAFVYQGSGKRQPDDAPPEQRLCIKESVRIQRCMARNAHSQARCRHEVEEWKLCCKRVKDAAERESKKAQKQGNK